MFTDMIETGSSRCLLLRDERSGLRAILALDSLALGPAVGGIRTLAYGCDRDALADATRLAKAMTLKCAIAGLNAGGGKTVVLSDPDMDRPRAFRRLGQYVADLKGLYRCAGDLGTTPADLREVANETEHVEIASDRLGDWCARGILACLVACTEHRGRQGLAGLRVAIQGCGMMGAATARRLAAEGAYVLLFDIDMKKARRLAEEIDAVVISANDIMEGEIDILVPCAAGGTITEETASHVRAWAICGAANNQLATPKAGCILRDRNIILVPDFLASAGAVIGGLGNELAKPWNADQLIARLGVTTRKILRTAHETGETTSEAAERVARARIASQSRVLYPSEPTRSS